MGNFTSGTVLSEASQISSKQLKLPYLRQQTEITYVLSNWDKLLVFDHSDPVDHSEVIFLHYPMMQVLLRGSVRTSGVKSSSLDGEQPRSQQPRMSTMREIWMHVDLVRRRPLLPVRKDIKLDTPHHGTSWTHGEEEKDHNDQPKDEL